MIAERSTAMAIEVAAVLDELVGQRPCDALDETWFAHLSNRLALAQAVVEQISTLRDDVLAAMLTVSTQREVAARLGLSQPRVGQLAQRANRAFAKGGR